MPGIIYYTLCNSQESPMRNAIMLIIPMGQLRFREDKWHQRKSFKVKFLKIEIKMKKYTNKKFSQGIILKNKNKNDKN